LKLDYRSVDIDTIRTFPCENGLQHSRRSGKRSVSPQVRNSDWKVYGAPAQERDAKWCTPGHPSLTALSRSPWRQHPPGHAGLVRGLKLDMHELPGEGFTDQGKWNETRNFL
jgi:hypothetical protein